MASLVWGLASNLTSCPQLWKLKGSAGASREYGNILSRGHMGIILLESLLTTSKQGVEQEKNMYGLKFGGSGLKSVQVLWRFGFKGLGLRVCDLGLAWIVRLLYSLAPHFDGDVFQRGAFLPRC